MPPARPGASAPPLGRRLLRLWPLLVPARALEAAPPPPRQCQAAASAEREQDAAAGAVSLLQAQVRKRPGHPHLAGAAEAVQGLASAVLGGGSAEDSDADASPSWCGLKGQRGFATLYADPSKNTLLIDLTDALANGKALQVVLTAMSVAGTWLDGTGQFARLAEPLEETENTLFEFRATADNSTVELYRPSLAHRTSDQQSREAVEKGVGDGWLGRIRTLTCEEPRRWSERRHAGDRIVIDGDVLIKNGFWVAPTLMQQSGYRLRSVRAFPRNFVVDVEFQMLAPRTAMAVGFSMIALAEEPMAPRAADDRLLYFNTAYKDIGQHHATWDKLPSETENGHISMIWRYNLPALPGRQIRIHVDPTVPQRWRPYFRQGIEAWNDGFKHIGQPQAVRAVLPEDPDWPEDYSMGDARYSTISWSVSDEVSSMGIAKVDPRSGEILKSDILMSDGWVQAWLEDLDLFSPNITHKLDNAGGHRTELLLLRSRLENGGELGAGRKAELLRSQVAARLRKRRSLANETEERRRELLGLGLKQIVMHETGHILGLRHNFKGSLGVSYECTQDMSCSAEHGLSASVMDYLPMNVAEAEGNEVHAFSPVLGGYDKLAIAYGYMELPGEAGPRLGGPPPPALELLKVLSDAEAYEVCYDDDMAGQDPTCVAYDFSADPLRYSESLLRRYAAVQRRLLDTSVAPGAPYERYGDAVQRLLFMEEDVGFGLVSWLGGVSANYAHRRLNGQLPNRWAIAAVPAAIQRRALRLFLRLLRPELSGLLPPKEHAPFIVSGQSAQGSAASDGHVARMDLGTKVREMVNGLLAHALSRARIEQIYSTESLAAAGSDEGTLSCGDFLAELVSGIMGPPDAADMAASLASATEPAEWDLQQQLVRRLKALHFDRQLPSAVASQVLYLLERLDRVVQAAIATVDDGSSEAALDEGPLALDEAPPGASPLLLDHLKLLRRELSEALCIDGKGRCRPSRRAGAARSK